MGEFDSRFLLLLLCTGEPRRRCGNYEGRVKSHTGCRGVLSTGESNFAVLMPRFERIKGVHLTLKPFSDDILTPTLKVKRYVLPVQYEASSAIGE